MSFGKELFGKTFMLRYLVLINMERKAVLFNREPNVMVGLHVVTHIIFVLYSAILHSVYPSHVYIYIYIYMIHVTLPAYQVIRSSVTETLICYKDVYVRLDTHKFLGFLGSKVIYYDVNTTYNIF